MGHLCILAGLGYIDRMEEYLSKGEDINEIDSLGDTPLMKAAAEENVDAVKFLLEKNAKVNVRNLRGNTALTQSMMLIHISKKKEEKIKIIQLLKRYGASIDATLEHDKTALSNFRERVSPKEFEVCFPEFCFNKTSTTQTNKGWLAQQWPSFYNWIFSSQKPLLASQEMQPPKTVNSPRLGTIHKKTE